MFGRIPAMLNSSRFFLRLGRKAVLVAGVGVGSYLPRGAKQVHRDLYGRNLVIVNGDMGNGNARIFASRVVLTSSQAVHVAIDRRNLYGMLRCITAGGIGIEGSAKASERDEGLS